MLFWVIGLSIYAIISTALWLVTLRKAKPVNNKRVQYTDSEKHSYQQKADQAMHLNQNFQKFVPRQFVEHIYKQGQSIGLGYADEDNVAIMFCDIRGFTGLSEQMSPQELMNFLNSYFSRMNAPIHDNKGFIDKFIGDSVNIAQRLETLAPVYDIDIIVTDQLVATAKYAFASRTIDWVRVKGRTEPLKLVEVLSHLPDKLQKKRLNNAEAIQQGLDLRIEGNLRGALDVFRGAKKLSPQDPVLKHHIKWTEQLILHGVPEQWDGALQLDHD